MKRKYYRLCPYCGRRLEQSLMVRTDTFDTGWMCRECYMDEEDCRQCGGEGEGDLELMIEAESEYGD